MSTQLTLAAITPMEVLHRAIEAGTSVDQLAQLLALQERWEANEARKAFNSAMARFKANPPRISKNKDVKFGQTEYSHATLDHVTEALTEAMSKVGISHKWSVKQEGAQISVACVLTHDMGHSETTTLSALPDTSGSKNSIQAIGSAVTYLQRYTLLAATGCAATSDDDGAGTSEKPKMRSIKRYIDLSEDIEGSTERAQLQQAFAKAYKEAKSMKDTAAMSGLQKVYDKRKAELR